jgi:hypothetical protein
MASIIGYSHHRLGPDKLVHIASRATFNNPYAGWWQSRCDKSFTKSNKRQSRPTKKAPTCLECIAAPEPITWVIPEDSWKEP